MQKNNAAGASWRRRFPAPWMTVAVAALVAGALAGCSSTSSKKVSDEDFQYLDPFGPKEFNEVATVLPAPPEEANLIPFQVGSTGNLQFSVDGKSISVGEDKAVRYTVVVQSPSGARTVSFEAVRCDVFERKLFATLPPGATKWVPNLSEGRDAWFRMDTSVRNNYAAVLAVEFLCEGRTPAGKADAIVRNLKASVPAHSRGNTSFPSSPHRGP